MTVVGGKFTTYRLMAERAADVVCAQLGVTKPCVTKDYVLPDARAAVHGHEAALAGAPAGRTSKRNTSRASSICECELVTRSDVEQRGRRAPRRGRALGAGRPAPRSAAGHGTVPGRLLRLSRRPASCTKWREVDAAQATAALSDFAQRRWKGQRPLLWGQSLRQALLDEQIYRGILGLDRRG